MFPEECSPFDLNVLVIRFVGRKGYKHIKNPELNSEAVNNN